MLHNTNLQVLKHNLLNSQMSKIYFFRALIAFVTSLIGIFVPVYLYSLNYEIILILLYSIGISTTYIISAPTVIWLINKIELKWTLFISSPFYLIYLISINYLDQTIIAYHLLWLSQGVYMSLFWICFKAEVISNSSSKRRANQIGALQSIVILLTAIAPIIGGFFLEYLTYQQLLYMTSFLLILSNLPLLLSKDKKIPKINFTHSDYKKLIQKKSNKQTKVTHICEGIELILSTFIWPIIFFIFVNENFATLGLIYTILSIITVIILMKIKNLIDKHPKKQILNKTSKLLSISWYLRTILTLFTSTLLFIFESLAQIITNITSITITTIFYNNTNEKNFIQALLTRTLYMHGTKIIFCSILIIILLMIENNFSNITMLLTFGIISSLGLKAINENEDYN